MRTGTRSGDGTLLPGTKPVKRELRVSPNSPAKSFRASKQAAKPPRPVPPPPAIPKAVKQSTKNPKRTAAARAGFKPKDLAAASDKGHWQTPRKAPAPAGSEKINLESVLYTMLFSLRHLDHPMKAKTMHISLAGEATLPQVLAALQRLETIGNIVRVDDAPDLSDTTWRLADQAKESETPAVETPPAAPQPHLGDAVHNAVIFIYLVAQHLARELEENWPAKGGTYASGLVSMSHDVTDRLLAAYDANR